MRVLLRHRNTQKFYAGLQNWTEDPSQAIDFEATDRAMDVAFKDELSSVEVLMHFDQPFFQIPLDIVGFGKE